MTSRLLSGGFELTVYDRDEAQVQRAVEAGAKPAASLEALCAQVDLVISMLPSDPILCDVAAGVAASGRDGLIHMPCGTHGVNAMAEVGAAHAAAGQALLACTVLGRPDRAAEGSLGLIVGGAGATVDGVRPVLDRLGQALFEPGEDPLSAVAIKIANNFILGCAIEAIGEGMALVRKYGVDPELFHQILVGGLFKCVAYEGYGDLIAKQDWARVGAAVTIGLKDADLAFEAGARVNVPLPSGAIWRDHLISAMGRGEGHLDWSVMAREQFRASGLE